MNTQEQARSILADTYEANGYGRSVVKAIRSGRFTSQQQLVAVDAIEKALTLSSTPSPSADWFKGEVDCDGNELITVRKDEWDRIHDLADKYKWQVRDTCARAEKAEATLTVDVETRARGLLDQVIALAWKWGYGCSVDDLHTMEDVGDSYNEGCRDDVKRKASELIAQIQTLAANPSSGVDQWGRMREALIDCRALIEDVEVLLSADPNMPTYQADYDAVENALDRTANKVAAALTAPVSEGS